MAPSWVKDVVQYVEWLDRCIDTSGSVIDGAGVVWTPIRDMSGETSGLIVPQQRLDFADGRHLTFRLVAETTPGGLAETTYSFHHGDPDGGLIWRACRNDLHVWEVGTRDHLHLMKRRFLRRTQEVTTITFGQVDFDEAVAAANEGRLPKAAKA